MTTTDENEIEPLGIDIIADAAHKAARGHTDIDPTLSEAVSDYWDEYLTLTQDNEE